MSVFKRLYHGQTRIDFIGSRRKWYAISAILLLVCVGSMAIKQFNFGIEFSGGNSFLIDKPNNSSISEVRGAVESVDVTVVSVQETSGTQARYIVRTPSISVEKSTLVKNAIADKLKIQASGISDNTVSASWGGQVTTKAIIGLIVFLITVFAYMWFRFEPKMAMAAILALMHDLLLTAGVYSLIGFEVTPSTVTGFLTILGFSLYDTVVVFDKVDENTKGLLSQSKVTYGQAANAAVNQTLMRSINTSLIALLPVAGLLFVGAGLLGVGVLKDLALVLFVGIATGAYSSLFLATPWLVDLKQREPRYKALLARVAKPGKADASQTDAGKSDAGKSGTEQAEAPNQARPKTAKKPTTNRQQSAKPRRAGTKRRSSG